MTTTPKTVRAILRARPEILFIPFAAIWLVVNVAPWGFGPSYVWSFYRAFTLQLTNVILPYTYGFAVICFTATLVLGYRWTSIGFGRCFLIAGTVVFAGPGAFEILFQETGRFVLPDLFAGYAQPYVMVSYLTWVLLGLTGAAWWRVTWRFWGFVVFAVVGWTAWVAIGFPLPATGTFAELPAAYVLNIALKADFYLIFVWPILEGMYLQRPGRPEPLPEKEGGRVPIASPDASGLEPTVVPSSRRLDPGGLARH